MDGMSVRQWQWQWQCDLLSSALQSCTILYDMRHRYLNNQVPIPGQEVSQWVDTWKTFYGNDPYNGLNASPSQLANVLGGEAAYVTHTHSFKCSMY
jgi:hypothetical protein